MTYIEGFIAAVPTANKAAYLDHANNAAPLMLELGVARMVENWGDDVPEGKVTDFAKAVQANPDESIIFSWFEYPDRATRDATNAKMMSDPRMAEFGGDMPFDPTRMVMGGFETLLDERGDGSLGYLDGIVLPVPQNNKDAYRALAEKTAAIFKANGAVRVVEGWGDDIPDGQITDFRRAVKAEEGENVVYSFIQWPDKGTRNAAWEAIMADPAMQPDGEMPFDGKRMFWGGFAPIVDTQK